MGYPVSDNVVLLLFDINGRKNRTFPRDNEVLNSLTISPSCGLGVDLLNFDYLVDCVENFTVLWYIHTTLLAPSSVDKNRFHEACQLVG